MADNARPSDDPLVAADEIAGVVYQRMKLTDAGPDSTTETGTDVNPLVVRGHSGTTATTTNVTASTSDTNLTAGNFARRSLSIFNESTAPLRILYEFSGVTTTYYKLIIPPGGYWEMPNAEYQGAICGMWDTATGFAMVVEI